MVTGRRILSSASRRLTCASFRCGNDPPVILAAAEGSAETATDTTEASTPKKLSLATLTAMVVGSMVGAGVFSLPARFGVATDILGSLIAWAIAGTGILMLAFVFQNLAIRKPELHSSRR
ncbi:hypothetical protein [Mumia zhuanghuii]|uniref:hypothetical protein n=1 Tax=Mumia zhuanghuii TaxID=2585211 RepID=UPI001E2E73BA|nr:hypothetical protein [Mumia zhuanghuii]